MKLSQKFFYKRYSKEVENMTRRCCEMNKRAETTVRKATPEENEYYLGLLEKAKKEAEIYEREKRRYYTYDNDV